MLGFAKTLFAELARNRVSLVAAGIAFYGLLSLFPGLAALMAVGGLLTTPALLVDQLRGLGAALPPEAQSIIFDQATQIAGSRSAGLGLSAIIGFGIALYSTSRGVASLVEGIHVAASQPDDRSFIASFVFTIGMTFLLLFFVLVAILGTVVVPIVLAVFGLTGSAVWVAALLRWPIMFVVITLFLGAFYRLSLCHKRPGIPWITAGGVIAALLWMVGSIFFSIYVENFAHYNISFGALGGVVTLLMWMWLSAYIILIGAEINAALDDSKAGAAEASARHAVSEGPS